jgi:hypothetical protein
LSFHLSEYVAIDRIEWDRLLGWKTPRVGAGENSKQQQHAGAVTHESVHLEGI